MGAVRKVGNSLGIKPLSETLTANNLVNLATNPVGMAANSLSNISGGSGNAGADLGLGNSLTGTGANDILVRAGVAGAGALAAPYLMGATAPAGAAAGTTAATGNSILDWANGVSKDTGGTGNVLTDLANGVKGSNIGSNVVSAVAGNYAADKQYQASKDALAESTRQFDIGQANSQPWITAGKDALGKQTDLMNNPSSYSQSPYDKWLQEQGAQGIERSAAAKGMGHSGNVLAALTEYNQGMAGKGFNDQFNRYASVAGTGQTQVNNNITAGQNYASDYGNSTIAGANAKANGVLSTGNALSNIFNPTPKTPSWADYMKQFTSAV